MTSFLLSAFYFDLVQFDFFEFPHSYICLCFLFALAEEKYITVQSYSGQGKDEIAFEKGVIVEVIQKNLEGWWFVRYTFHPLLWAHSFWFFFFLLFFQENDDKPDIFVHSLTDIRTKKAGLQLPT